MGYVRNTYGCHCFYGDSSFKRYNRSLGGDTLIFNYNSNNTYNCCGGSRGGFWGGLGMGLGMGFGNILGSFCGNMFGGFGNMFGGFGMGNMFGGFPSWGNFGNWGFGGTPAANNNTTTPSTPSTPSTTITSGLDKDNPKIEAFSKALDDTYGDGKANLDQTAYDKELAKLKDLKKGLDGVQDPSNKQWLNDLLGKLNALADEGTEIVDSLDDDAKPRKKGKDKDLSSITTGNNLGYIQTETGAFVTSATTLLKNLKAQGISDFTFEIKGAYDEKIKDLVANSDQSVEYDATSNSFKSIKFKTASGISLSYSPVEIPAGNRLHGTDAYVMQSATGNKQSYTLMAYVKDKDPATGKATIVLVLDQNTASAPDLNQIGVKDQ
ncbi:MAG: hypothetical protein NC408_00905 [Candidatus Gastranaerophilales bacterium]|nr:hypothetical protein [Candidatus Gastranaerophilales bacterium]MCM1073921.1 hypothetical protein [Bacteroides sp.]